MDVNGYILLPGKLEIMPVAVLEQDNYYQFALQQRVKVGGHVEYMAWGACTQKGCTG